MEQTNEELEVVKVDDDEINCEEKLREINGVASDSETKTVTDITTTKVRFVSFILNLIGQFAAHSTWCQVRPGEAYGDKGVLSSLTIGKTLTQFQSRGQVTPTQ